jgi:hypothetical protein
MEAAKAKKRKYEEENRISFLQMYVTEILNASNTYVDNQINEMHRKRPPFRI